MHKSIIIVFCLATGMTLLGQNAVKTQEDHITWLAQQLSAVSAVKPGMTRREVKQVFTEASGMSSGVHERFNPKTCRYIVIEIEFRRSPNPTLRMDDTVISVSRPFLEKPVYF